MNRLLTYAQFVLNEGGKAIDDAQPVSQSEVDGIVKLVKSEFEKAQSCKCGITGEIFKIGSAGLKKDGEMSGDVDMCWIVEGDRKEKLLKLKGQMERLGHVTNYMPGLEILSVAFAFGEKTVQVDFIASSDRTWAEFIYHSPDYRNDESKYKSAHRNWMFSAILSQLVEDVEKDAEGNMPAWTGYMLRLQDGLYRVRKSRVSLVQGGGLNQHPRKESEEIVTNKPIEFVKFLFGDGHQPSDVATFEDVFSIITKDGFKHAGLLSGIIKKYREFLDRAKLPVPYEIKELDDDEDQ